MFHSQGEIFLDTEDEKEFGGLLDTEREFDVNEILKVNTSLLLSVLRICCVSLIRLALFFANVCA